MGIQQQDNRNLQRINQLVILVRHMEARQDNSVNQMLLYKGKRFSQPLLVHFAALQLIQNQINVVLLRNAADSAE
ncbi:hypothetical protein D3C73_906190 [compost metagenome]